MTHISRISSLSKPRSLGGRRRLPRGLQLPILVMPFVVLASACHNDLATAPEVVPPPSMAVAVAATVGFRWGTGTPESQGMCGSAKQLGCTKTLLQIWTEISKAKYNTNHFIVIRNDKIIYERGVNGAYLAYSANKGLLGAPTLVHAMSACGVGLTDPASKWLEHGEGARWGTDYPWTDITVENLATHTSGICDYDDTIAICHDENPGWQLAYERSRVGGTNPNFAYPNDAFTVARAKAEQNTEPALPPGSTFAYSNVGHALLNYVVQKACGLKLADIFDTYIKQVGMGSAVNPALISTDDGQQFNQSTGLARWKGVDGAAVLRLAARRGIWANKNVEPVRYWNEVTKITGNLPVAAANGWGVVYSNNSNDTWTKTAGHRRLSPETFGHGGDHSNIFLNDPLTNTIIVRQSVYTASGAPYLTINGCAPGWTGTAPTCKQGTNWSNNWNVPSNTMDAAVVGPRTKVVDPLQEAFFFPPPFCTMVSAAGTAVDNTTDVYDSPQDATTIDLTAQIQINPREGASSSKIDKVQFYKETDGTVPILIGNGILVPGTSPAQYKLAYGADSHGAVGEVRTYFASCIAKSAQDVTKKVPSYSRPVRVKRQ